MSPNMSSKRKMNAREMSSEPRHTPKPKRNPSKKPTQPTSKQSPVKNSPSNVTAEFRPLVGDGAGNYVLLIHMDFGTSKAAVTWAVILKGTFDPTKPTITVACFQNNEFSVPTTVAFKIELIDGLSIATLVFGTDAEEDIDTQAISQHHKFRRIKQSNAFVSPSSVKNEAQRADIEELHREHARAFEALQNADKVQAFFPLTGMTEITIDKTQDSQHGMADVVACFLIYFRQLIMRRLEVASALTRDEVETLFSEKARIGIAVPDLWSAETRNNLVSLLVGVGYPVQTSVTKRGAGFPETVSLTSESKSASASMLKQELERIKRLDEPQQDSELQALASKNVVQVDIGAGTTDISSLQVKILKRDQNGHGDRTEKSLRFVTVIDSISCRNGGDQVNHALKQLLKPILAPVLEDMQAMFVEKIGRKSTMGEFLSYFTTGIEKAKTRISLSTVADSGEEKVFYWGPGSLPAKDLSGGVKISGKLMYVPTRLFRDSFDDQLKALLGKDGLVARHVARTRKESRKFNIVVMLSGGGSLSPYVFDKFRTDSAFTGITISQADNRQKSWVAEGGICCLLDPAICQQQKLLKSYGVKFDGVFRAENKVHKKREKEKQKGQWPHAGKDVLPDSIFWISKKGALSMEPSDVSEPFSYQLEPEVSDPKDLQDMWVEWDIWCSGDDTVAHTSGHNVYTNKSIKPAGTIRGTITPQMARKIGVLPAAADNGLIRDEDGRWLLDFDVKLQHKWTGLIHTWVMQIPYRVSAEDTQPTGNFEFELRAKGDLRHGAFAGDHNEEDMTDIEE